MYDLSSCMLAALLGVLVVAAPWVLLHQYEKYRHDVWTIGRIKLSLKRCDRCNGILLWGGERNDVFTKGGGVCERCVMEMSDVGEGDMLLKKIRAVMQICAPTELGMFEHQLERIRNGELDDEIHELKNENRRLKTELDNLTDPNRITVDHQQWLNQRSELKWCRWQIAFMSLCFLIEIVIGLVKLVLKT